MLHGREPGVGVIYNNWPEIVARLRTSERQLPR